MNKIHRFLSLLCLIVLVLTNTYAIQFNEETIVDNQWDSTLNLSDAWNNAASNCWNGLLEAWEQCDNWNDNWSEGNSCSIECTLIDNPPVCWNWKIDEWESLQTCPEDVWNSSESECWNGLLEAWEQCDNWNDNWSESNSCSIECTIIDNPPVCWNWKIDEWESLQTCPEDVWNSSESECWNWLVEDWEQCDNWNNNWYDWMCSFECKTTNAICWNGLLESWEQCDHWNNNWSANDLCTNKCTIVNPISQQCWNWIIEEWETCLTCPQDVWICTTSECWNWLMEDWEQCDNWNNNWYDWMCSFECKTTNAICWNGLLESWEQCDHWNNNWSANDLCTNKCTIVNPISQQCWNWIIEEWETCLTCPSDVWICAENICWNGLLELWEECDDWKNNWSANSLCSSNCMIISAICWNWRIEKWEECDNWINNWKNWNLCSINCKKIDIPSSWWGTSSVLWGSRWSGWSSSSNSSKSIQESSDSTINQKPIQTENNTADIEKITNSIQSNIPFMGNKIFNDIFKKIKIVNFKENMKDDGDENQVTNKLFNNKEQNKIKNHDTSSDILKVSNSDLTETANNTSEHNSADVVKFDNFPLFKWAEQEIWWSWYIEEINNAYELLYKSWIINTSLENIDIDWELTRIEMAMLLSNFAMNVLWEIPDIEKKCSFDDLSVELNREYGYGWTIACQLWIMWVNIKNLRPNEMVTRAHFATSLSRMLYWIEDSPGNYYESHINKLSEEWIINYVDPLKIETRWDAMIMLMRAAEKYK